MRRWEGRREKRGVEQKKELGREGEKEQGRIILNETSRQIS